jgi:hypothetical protein
MSHYRSRRLRALPFLAVLLFVGACSSSNETAATEEPTRPTVQATFPLDGATDHSRSGPYWIVFSLPMDESSVEQGLSLTPGPVGLGASWRGDTLFVTPAYLLSASTAYTFTVSGTSEALNGQTLGSDYSFSFTTTAASDDTPPTVLSTSPAGGAVNVSGVAPVAITFSEPMDPSATWNAIEITPGPPDAYYEWEATTLIIHHSAFPQITTMTVTVSTDARDLAGNHLAAPYGFSFTTRTDNTRPYLMSASPANGATGVSTGLSQIVLTFSEPMDQMSFEMPPEAVDARVIQAAHDEPTANTDFSELTVPVTEPLLPGCTYWVNFLDVKDGGGNVIDPNPTAYQFTTAGTASYFPAKTDAVWHYLGEGTWEATRTIDHYNQAAGTFEELFLGGMGEIEGITYFKKTSSAIQHLGRSNYDGGTFQFTMMWNQPIPYIKLPISNYLGQSWNFSATATVGDTIDVDLSGHIEIEPATVNLVNTTLHGTFKGCYVHHLYADLYMSHDGNPVDEQHVHQILWLAPGVGPVQIVDIGGGSDTLRVVDWNSLY